ncbi:MAG: hypothetical protein WCC63_08665 [Candidatus Bathyarchaeia archaeon]
MEVKVIFVGVVLCLLGLTLFVYGLVTMTYAGAMSSSFLIVVGIFLGMGGLLVLAMTLFSGGSLFT